MGGPGRDTAWDDSLLWQYLLHRRATCKPSTLSQVLTMLAHFGALNNHVLPTKKFDGQPALHRAIGNMKKQLRMDAREAQKVTGVSSEVEHCTPLGKKIAGIIFSAFGMFTRSRFRALARVDRHNLVVTAMQHTAAMRFGNFLERDYKLDSFLRDADGSFRLVTDYHRYAGRRMYCMQFPSDPKFDAMRYELTWPDGAVFDTIIAATIMQ